MPRDLFGDVTRPSISLGTRKWYTVPLSLLSHSLIVGAVVIVPLMATDVLPAPWQKIDDYVTIITPPSPPPPPKPIQTDDGPPPKINPDAAPLDAPSGIEPERPLPDASWQDTPIGVIDGTGGDAIAVVAPPPPPQPAQPVRVGGAVRAPQRIHHAHPVYPQIAMAAGVSGIVIIEATIGTDGRITNARVLRSIPLLDQAAIEAVRQWQYTPTTLNGMPVPVIMTVTVVFNLK